MFKRIIVCLIILIILVSCRDLRDHDGKFFKHYEDFFNHTFENGYELKSEDTTRFNNFGDEPITLYTFEYQDNFNQTRTFEIETVSLDVSDGVLERSLDDQFMRILQQDIKKRVVSKHFENDVLVLTFVYDVNNRSSRDTKLSSKNGIKLSNIYDFFNSGIMNKVEVFLLFESQKDKDSFEFKKDLIIDDIKSMVGNQIPIEIFVKDELIEAGQFDPSQWD